MINKISATASCPCSSGVNYSDCCQPYHLGQLPLTAEQLMRSRYTAFVLQNIDYVVATTVPSQQALLDQKVLKNWAATTNWVGLNILKHQENLAKTNSSPKHSAVEFEAFFQEKGQKQRHHEYSLFVQIGERWYFVDPTVMLPTMKQPCLCGSEKKFKHCCGGFL